LRFASPAHRGDHRSFSPRWLHLSGTWSSGRLWGLILVTFCALRLGKPPQVLTGSDALCRRMVQCQRIQGRQYLGSMAPRGCLGQGHLARAAATSPGFRRGHGRQPRASSIGWTQMSYDLCEILRLDETFGPEEGIPISQAVLSCLVRVIAQGKGCYLAGTSSSQAGWR
jgi:hypothetical protein